MSEKINEIPEPVIGALLSSGFPFQTAIAKVAHLVQACNVVAEEWPWRDEAGADQFLDLVVTKGFFVLPIECKKTQKETLTFLQPGGSDGDVIRARSLHLTQIQDSTKRMELYCTGLNFSPKSAESAFALLVRVDLEKISGCSNGTCNVSFAVLMLMHNTLNEGLKLRKILSATDLFFPSL